MTQIRGGYVRSSNIASRKNKGICIVSRCYLPRRVPICIRVHEGPGKLICCRGPNRLRLQSGGRAPEFGWRETLPKCQDEQNSRACVIRTHGGLHHRRLGGPRSKASPGLVACRRRDGICVRESFGLRKDKTITEGRNATYLA